MKTKKNNKLSKINKLNRENNKTIKKNNDNKKRILTVGMLTVPLNPDGKYFEYCGKSYIVTAHLDWLKSNNVKIIPIPYYKKNFEKYVKKVNGFYLPSGGAFAGTQPEYYFAAKKLIQLAIQENNKGNYFPVWGGCMGMQQMVIAAEGSDNYNGLLEVFDSKKNLYLPLKFTDIGRESKIFSLYTKKQIKDMEAKKCSLHNHMMGISPEKFKKHRQLNNFYDIVNISYDRNNKPFVSTIEGKKYPFYGVQWHPERKKNFYKLSVFFVNELKKNTNKILNLNRKKIKTKKVKCMKYSNDLYKYCNFYWEKDDKKNNPKMCNKVAVSRKNKKRRVYDVIG